VNGVINVEKVKSLISNRYVIHSLIVLALAAAGAAISEDQADKLTDVVLMILSLLS